MPPTVSYWLNFQWYDQSTATPWVPQENFLPAYYRDGVWIHARSKFGGCFSPTIHNRMVILTTVQIAYGCWLLFNVHRVNDSPLIIAYVSSDNPRFQSTNLIEGNIENWPFIVDFPNFKMVVLQFAKSTLRPSGTQSWQAGKSTRFIGFSEHHP